LAKFLSGLDIRAKLLFCLVIFAIQISANGSLSATGSEPPAGQTESELKIVSIRITGSMCPACLKRLEDKLKQMNGVAEAKITPLPFKKVRPSLKEERHPHYRKALVEIDYKPGETDQNQLVEAIKQNDFGIVSVSSHKYQQPEQSTTSNQ
jgi:copper chaperone CopZ